METQGIRVSGNEAVSESVGFSEEDPWRLDFGMMRALYGVLIRITHGWL